MTPTFDIETQTEVLGKVHRKFFSLMPEYHLLDNQENLLAKSRMRFFSFFTIFDVEDCYHNNLGTVEERFSWVFPTFLILAPNGKKLGEAVLNFWGTKYTITDPSDGHVIITISRPFFHLKSNWTINIIDSNVVNENQIHPHLLMTLAAFQVDKEYWEKRRREWENNQSEYSFFSKQMHKKGRNSNQDDNLYANHQNFKEILRTCRKKLTLVDPLEEDYEFVDSLGGFPLSTSLEENYEVSVTKTLELLDLLDTDCLTEGQKSALFLMLESKLSNFSL